MRETQPIVLAYGGGTNSTAMLVGLMERGERVDLILFADTGGERPETYEHVRRVSEWLVARGMPAIVTVRYEKETLEDNCLRINGLPSIAYGYKKCSLKFKRDPQDKFCNNHPLLKAAWKRGGKVLKLIGYDADEPNRANRVSGLTDTKYDFRYPLIEWDWGREECVEAIARAGLPQPGKSACFFCPSSKKPEIFSLAVIHPHLAKRALEMERQAELTSVKGLGRAYAWEQYLMSVEDSLSLFVDCDEVFGPLDSAEINLAACDFSDAGKTTDCGCYDGDD